MSNAAIAGDVAMLAGEVTPVLKALRKNGLDVVAIHHHMTADAADDLLPALLGHGPGGQAGDRVQGGARGAREVESTRLGTGVSRPCREPDGVMPSNNFVLLTGWSRLPPYSSRIRGASFQPRTLTNG